MSLHYSFSFTVRLSSSCELPTLPDFLCYFHVINDHKYVRSFFLFEGISSMSLHYSLLPGDYHCHVTCHVTCVSSVHLFVLKVIWRNRIHPLSVFSTDTEFVVRSEVFYVLSFHCIRCRDSCHIVLIINENFH